MSLCVDTESAVKEAVDQAIREVFRTMAGESLTLVSDEYMSVGTDWDDPKARKLTAILGLTGGIQGSLCLSLTDQAAIQWAESILLETLSHVDQTVIDAVGELGNMVVGGAKRRLEGNNLSMSLPTVLRVADTALEFGTNLSPVKMWYQYSGHTMVMTIAVRRR